MSLIFIIERFSVFLKNLFQLLGHPLLLLFLLEHEAFDVGLGLAQVLFQLVNLVVLVPLVLLHFV